MVSDGILIIPGKYYVYGHYTLDGVLFYVGMGNSSRICSEKERSNEWWQMASHGYTVRMLDSFDKKSHALDLERRVIVENQSQLVNISKNPSNYKGFFSGIGSHRTHPCGTRAIRVTYVGSEIIFNSIYQASQDTGVNRNGIHMCCNGKRKSACGFKWYFVDTQTQPNSSGEIE